MILVFHMLAGTLLVVGMLLGCVLSSCATNLPEAACVQSSSP